MSAKFTGQERDTETSSVGLDFFKARYHGSAQGRFLSPDPLGNIVATTADPQSWNMYAYARNNPLTLVDPTGFDYCDWGDGVLDSDPFSGGSTQQQCEDWGGTWTVPTINDNVTDQVNTGQVTYTDPTLDEDALDPGFTFGAPPALLLRASRAPHREKSLTFSHVPLNSAQGTVLRGPFSILVSVRRELAASLRMRLEATPSAE
jgi:RHS repeat-associated protein